MNDLKFRISLTAQELFLREGVDGISMRKIAERVGVTAPAIYRHYRDKDELLQEIIDAGLTILSEYLAPALKAEGPYERLRGLIDAYVRFAMEQPKYFNLAFLVPGPTIHLTEELKRQSQTTFQLAVKQVELCMETGVFRKGDPIETAVYLWSTAHGLVMLHRMNRLGNDVQEFSRLCRNTIERAIQGLREKG